MATGYLLPIGTILQFFTDQGVVLAGGKIYTYTAGTTTPVATYTSSTLVTPNANPIILGSSGRLPASCWVGAGVYVKMVLQDSSGNVISGGTIDNLQGINDFSNLSGANVGKALWAQTTAETAASITPSNYAYPPGNVLRYGADPTSSSDSSLAISNACLVNTSVYIPGGTYLCNITVTKPVVISGDGSLISVLKPNSALTAIITWNCQTSAWSYSPEIRDIGFKNTGLLGIGVAFGSSSQAGYAAGMELANNVKFYGCRFSGLNKGVQFTFGNIGTEFYSCGFNGNYYGVYSLDNKQYPSASGSSPMHAGCKYFFGGEFDNNTCAVYVNNATIGFGAINFYGTIFQINNIAVYCYSNADASFVPISFNDVWTETNGAFVSASNVTIDSWSGSVVSTQSVAPHTYIFDGTKQIIGFNGGFFTDTEILATNSRVISKNSVVETVTGFSGKPFVCTGSNSQIIITDPTTTGGIVPAANTLVVGQFKPIYYDITTAASTFSRVFVGSHRYNKCAGSYGGTVTVVNGTTASNLGSGSFNVTATTTSDGTIYGTCNNAIIPFTTSNQQTALIASTVSLVAGKWYVMTCDVKLVSGTNVQLDSWDRSTNALFTGFIFPSTGDWYTVIAMGYSPNNVATFYGLDFSSITSGTVTVNYSAFQFVSFNSEYEAMNFVASNVYIGP